MGILQWPNQSPDLNRIQLDFLLLKTKLKAKRHTMEQQLKAATINAWQIVSREETAFIHIHVFKARQLLSDFKMKIKQQCSQIPGNSKFRGLCFVSLSFPNFPFQL